MKSPKMKAPPTVEQQIRTRTIRSFLIFGILIVAAVTGWRWLYHSHGAENDTYIHEPLRKVADANEYIFSSFFSTKRKVKTYALKDAEKNVRVNGGIGMGDDFKPETWRLKLVRNPGDTQLVTLNQIRQYPKRSIVFDFKCIEGWDQVTHWGGLPFSDFIKYFHLEEQAKKKYIGLVTPDGKYYVGIDMESALQPQTMLCYEMNGAALPYKQGFPLRLIIPVKYGIKHLKRIGTLFFSDTPPRDYWAEQGYDYYSGH